MEQKQAAEMALSLGFILLVAVMVGIVLLIIGAGVGNGNKGVYLAGLAITALSLFAGGFLQKDENNVVRLGLFLSGAILLAFLTTGTALVHL
jgi:hypothetical protein